MSDTTNIFVGSMAKKYMDARACPFRQTGDERVIAVIFSPGHFTLAGCRCDPEVELNPMQWS